MLRVTTNRGLCGLVCPSRTSERVCLLLQYLTKLNAGETEIVSKKEGEEKGSARGSVHWSGYDATALG